MPFGAGVPLAAGGLELDGFRAGLAALGGVGDLGHRRVGADVAGVDQVAGLAAEDVEAEVADRRVGDDWDRRLQQPAPSRLRFSPGTRFTWPLRMKARRGRPPEPETA